MDKFRYYEKKRKEALSTLKRLEKLIKNGEYVPYSIGIWESGLNNTLHAKFEFLPADSAPDYMKNTEDS